MRYEDRSDLTPQLAGRLKELRLERNWSLDQLAHLSGVSRATLSRLENAEVSPTASVLGKVCAAYGVTLSRLMHLVEDKVSAFIPHADQPVWRDPAIDFARRSVSPPTAGLGGEVIECRLGPDVRIDYARPPRIGLEHHLVMLEGALRLSIDSQEFDLKPGDCLRYQLYGASCFVTPKDCGARYYLFMV